ncbi:MAG TPA: hypothetical protein VMN77_08665 [Nitrospiria bacterium]|jgi:hypothetical protein|nr:hypothetical protein [Nitrospiria bacterium]
MKILQRLFRFLKQGSYPKTLLIKGRTKLSSSAFQDDDKLFRAFQKDDLDENENIRLETIKFPDISSNWSRFSVAKDVKFRKNGLKTDGCYSITVLVSRFKKIATPVHHPISDCVYPNYAHVEIRVLYEGEDVLFEPPRGRKIKPKSKKLEYRQNLKDSLQIELRSE